MKKIIYSLLVLAMTAFTFSSCEDVPAPYPIPEESGNNGGNTGTETDGTEANPFTVTDAKKQTSDESTYKYVKGYIVGYVPSGSQKLSDTKIGDASNESAIPTNVLIAESADETNYNNCIPVQLPAGDIRTNLNLKDNPGNLKKEVLLCGNVMSYFGIIGVKNTCYAKIGDKEIGSKPSSTPDTPIAGEAKGTGTEADPFNSVAAYQKAKELTEGGVSTESYYIKGKVRTITEQYGAQYGNTTVEIADDETSQIFTIYRALYFGNKKWVEGDKTLNVGDEVVFYGPIMNYKGSNGTTPETESGKAYLISINGEKGSGTVTPDPTPEPTVDNDGTEAKPFNVTEVIAKGYDPATKGVYIKAYIIGSAPGQAFSSLTFTTDGASGTNIAIAASVDETDAAKCIPVQLPKGTIRDGLNLSQNATNFKQEVILYGDIDKYFGMVGIKNVTYAKIGDKEIGTKP